MSGIYRSKNYVRIKNASNQRLQKFYPGNVVKYGFTDTEFIFYPKFKSDIRFVIQSIENLTCLKFEDIGDDVALARSHTLNNQELRRVCQFNIYDYNAEPGPNKPGVFQIPRHNLIPFDALWNLHKTFCSGKN
uniref:Uncharacterized protein n=1 Tax=Romanomermis culicivorax TaxID=13658 RepID=A0A915IHZ9_ROMCU